MKTSPEGRALIRQFEGCMLTAYQDSVRVWTIGVGHTDAAGPPRVHPGMKITQAEADAILARDLTAVENDVNKLVEAPLTQNQFDALVSFHFNTGGLGRSTLLKRLNSGGYNSIPFELAKWDKAGGQTLKGLTRRRKAEGELWARLSTPPDVERPPVTMPPAPKEDHWLTAIIKAVVAIFRR